MQKHAKNQKNKHAILVISRSWMQNHNKTWEKKLLYYFRTPFSFIQRKLYILIEVEICFRYDNRYQLPVFCSINNIRTHVPVKQ